ncbi:galactose-1-phosphate uridylyltransferase [Candidatus Oleimmundimicrobium sp.]|uniref:galactose-1-phosphate uridylyltransferase n=1 Tax=Candidatus Oleimmundimicrobium sp. TaxID=3060597 RepID=UPI00271C51B6|nr:galactose-1-phosphate uridylyltransferase [Candidatus Oleimmundimicrobium sp.]MDO8885877.1 galactose-1-phosphate uridylyltransferase [Candidatus Oleimmundimicrobium sp.]
MPELRREPITGRWVVIATKRAKRPESFTQKQRKPVKLMANCPFCYGNEGMTPSEVLAFRPKGTKPNSSGWKVRVVPNKFPAFTMKSESEIKTPIVPTEFEDKQTGRQKELEIYSHRPALGVHEVIVSSPDHVKSLALLTEQEVELVIEAYCSRLLDIKKDSRIKQVLIIVNHGEEAGTSIEHPHSQLFGMPIIPPVVAEEISCADRYFRKTGQCVFCNILAEELKMAERIITESEYFLSFSPYASRQPFETWIVPKKHLANFELISLAEKKDFASILKSTLGKIYKGLDDPPYNFYLHTSPFQMDAKKFYHWHIEILPKLSIQAGFEMGSGIMINVVSPEEAAKFLRNF